MIVKAIQFSATKCGEIGVSLERRGRMFMKSCLKNKKSIVAGLLLEEETKPCMLECIKSLK